jgi:cyclopropane fatty-acyl-phospholipid synthase-like methyltransferase
VEECRWERLAPFDLIYSLSWLDSTDDEQALRWLSAAAELLRPGGRILAANFTSCRSEEQLAQLVIQLKHPQVRGHAVFRDESGTSAFLEIYSL